jgi:hypothetical protein
MFAKAALVPAVGAPRSRLYVNQTGPMAPAEMPLMWTKIVLAGLGLAVAGLVGTALVTRRQVERETAHRVDTLLGAASLRAGTFQAADLDGLPTPVQGYLRRVLREGQPHVRALRVEQRGTFRAGDATAAWRPFTATQHVIVRPPGFVWDASIRMMAGLPVRVLDAYHDGRGVLEARLGGVLPVMTGAPGPELDEGELLRYLAEAPLYPTALLPGMGVTWTPIDDRSARATLTDRGTTATLVFHFNDTNEVARVEGRRSFTKSDGTAEERPWRGYWRDYAERGGMWVPTRGKVAWVHPEAGEVSYWRGRLHTFAYDIAGEDETPHRTMPSESGPSTTATAPQ